MRVIAQISIYGKKVGIDQCAAVASIPNGQVEQIGLRRKIPEVDSWCYSSPRYRFHLDLIDVEILEFLSCHTSLRDALKSRNSSISHALLTLCPIQESTDESFACIFSCQTLEALLHLGLELEISPASVMPEVDYWTDRTP